MLMLGFADLKDLCRVLVTLNMMLVFADFEDDAEF